MRRLLWIDESKEYIIFLYKNGYKQKEIADMLGTSQGVIGSRLRIWGESNSDGNRFKRLSLDIDAIEKMYWKQELHPAEIAKEFCCSKKTIVKTMKINGVPLRTKSQSRMGRLNPMYNAHHTKETRAKMSASFVSGKRMGYNTHWGKGVYYISPNQGKVWMRSGWEVKVADYLTKYGIDWYYEYEWLAVGLDKNYLPDFFLPIQNLYIEVKGRKKKKDMEKFEAAQNRYKVVLWDSEELLKRGIIKNSGNTELNRKYKNCKMETKFRI